MVLKIENKLMHLVKRFTVLKFKLRLLSIKLQVDQKWLWETEPIVHAVEVVEEEEVVEEVAWDAEAVAVVE